MIIPQYLSAGDTIGITATARKISREEVMPAVRIFENLGFNIKLATNLFVEDNQLAGSDTQRAASFMEFITDDTIKAIICARGGYGTVKILDYLDFDKIANSPKWICGYSDVTVLHLLYNKLGLCSIHSTMPINFPKDDSSSKSVQSLLNMLYGAESPISANEHPLNIHGECNGELIGGNLSLIYALQGTDLHLNPDNKILFFEDLDEYLYHIDRMMVNLKMSGILNRVSGIAVGYLNDMNDNAIPYGKNAEEIVYEHIKELGIPVAFGLPIGHLEPNMALCCGKSYTMRVTDYGTLLQHR